MAKGNVSNWDGGDDGWEVVANESGTPINLAEGEIFAGTYNGMRTVMTEDLNGSPGNKDRESKLYEFMKDGELHTLWGSYSIDTAFEKISTGSEVRITFKGKRSIRGGKQTLKEYRVEHRAPVSA